jgi:D-alanyl-D-alanine dipeptidase
LVKKWKRALELFSNAKEAFEGLSDTADADMLQVWERNADEAQKKRSMNVKAMEYFAVRDYPGEWFDYISITL